VFKIGDFSKLSQISVKTLRYYDELGLIKPRKVDELTGYRYYSADQLPLLNRILALKDLGLNLEQVARVLKENVSPEQLRGMLRLKQAEILQRMQQDADLFAHVEIRLKLIEKEGQVPDHEVAIKKLPTQTIMSVRKVIPNYASITQLWEAICPILAANTVKLVGPPLAIYHDSEYREQDVDIELGVPVGPGTLEQQGVTIRELPAVETAACLVHQGPYEELSQSYQLLGTWIQTHGYRITGASREVYLSGPESGAPETYVTEIQLPVERGEENGATRK
jgi:effector-binding domain-containing protein